MSILSGYKKFKRYVLTDNGYQLCSFWTSSNTVHFDDGKTAETKLEELKTEINSRPLSTTVKHIEKVSALPSTAETNTTTLYLI